MESAIYGEENWSTMQEEFSHLKGSIYFDHAGTALYTQRQLQCIFEELNNSCFGNPHSRHPSSRLTADVVEQTRIEILHFFGADPEYYDLIFTSGTTQSLKLVAENFSFSSGDINDGCGSFFYLKESHTSVVGMRECTLARNVPTFCLPSEEAEKILKNRNGSLDRSEFEKDSISSKKNSSKEMVSQNGYKFNNSPDHVNTKGPCSLVVYPAQCNFSGYKYPLEWIKNIQDGQLEILDPKFQVGIRKDTILTKHRWFCLLDAASFVSTNPLRLNEYMPGFVAVSFYKIFGYPTGLGALIVRKDAAHLLKKSYFGGGTVHMYSASKHLHVPRTILHERFEDGTINFLSIIALRHGIRIIQSLAISMEHIASHTFYLSKYLYGLLSDLKYDNGANLVEIYSATAFQDLERQGGIMSFNLKKRNGQYIGYVQVEKVLALHDIHVRTGCFCNPSACQLYLRLSDEEIQYHFDAGHVCGDEVDIVDGKPTGAVRISVGYMSTKDNVHRLVDVLKSSFLHAESIVEESAKEFEPLLTGTPRLIGINVYPIKSCGAFVVDHWPVNSSGLLYDRRWVVVNQSGVALTQKRERRLCLIRPEIDLENRLLILHYQGKNESFTLSIDDHYETNCYTKVCSQVVQTVDCGSRASEWLNRILDQTGLKLLKYLSPSGSLANDSQFLLVNRNSVLSLQRHSSSSRSIPANEFTTRFRANLVIDDTEEFTEDSWKKIQIGRLHLLNEGPCSRCQMVCIDQDTAERNQSLLMDLAKLRGRTMPFGIHLRMDQTIEGVVVLRVGDAVSF